MTDLPEIIRAFRRGELCLECGDPAPEGEPCPACAEKRELLRQAFPRLYGDS